MFDVATPVFLGATLIGVALPLLLWSVASSRPGPKMANRLEVPTTDLRKLVLQQGAGERVVAPGFATLARGARAISPIGLIDRLDKKIKMAGMQRDWPLERVLAVKVILLASTAVIFAMRWVVDPTNGRALLAAIFMPIAAFALPDLFIGVRGRNRQDEIARSLPDILDQITIAVEAGLGFEAALAHVSTHVSTPLGEEFAHALQDIRVGFTREQAFSALNDRTDVPELRQFVIALQQAEKLGIPIAQVLRIQASELRTIRRQRAEENAQKLPVKMILPLVLFILPALVIVVLAPAVFDAMDTFGS